VASTSPSEATLIWGDVDLEVEALALDAVPAELAVILVEDDADVAGGHHGGLELAVAVHRGDAVEADGVAVEGDRRLDILAGDGAAERGGLDRCGHRWVLAG